MKNLLIIFLRLSKPLGLLKYIFLMPVTLQCQSIQTEQSCAKDNYPSLGTVMFSGPAHDQQNKKLDYMAWVIPSHKIKCTKNGYTITHPSFANECDEEKSFLNHNPEIDRAIKDNKKIVISLTIRDGKPDNDWKFVMVW